MTKRSRFSRLRAEPLWLFLLLGLLVFVVDRITPDRASAAEYQIDVTAEKISRMLAVWQAQTNRQPTDQELDALIEESIREEVLFREALRLGLDQDDVIVRRRLAQKMGFFIEDAAASKSPSEQEQREFFAANTDRYRLPERISFSHVYFSRDERGESAHADAVLALAQLSEAAQDSKQGSAWRRFGDPFMLLREYAERSEQELVELFGGNFVRSLASLSVGAWQGPVESAYGLHLVKIQARIAPEPPLFERFREQVEQDYVTEQRRVANERYYRELRDRYKINLFRSIPAEVTE